MNTYNGIPTEHLLFWDFALSLSHARAHTHTHCFSLHFFQHLHAHNFVYLRDALSMPRTNAIYLSLNIARYVSHKLLLPTSKMPMHCTKHQDAFVWEVYLVGEKDERGNALFANTERGVGIFLQNCHSFLPIHRIQIGWHILQDGRNTIITNSIFFIRVEICECHCPPTHTHTSQHRRSRVTPRSWY